MNLSDNLFKGFQKQYGVEVGNYSVYQNLANVAGNLSWSGFEKFFQEYALDEITHAQKIADFIIARNRTPYVDTLPNPQVGNSEVPLDWFQVALTKAQAYTAIIKELYRQCEAEKDESAQVFPMWYLSEQSRVEAFLWNIIQKLKRAGSNASIQLIEKYLVEEELKK